MTIRQPYSVDELMVCQMARHLPDGVLVVQGIATPLVLTALVLAKLTGSPNLYFMYTQGCSLAFGAGPVSISRVEDLTLDGCLRRVTMTEINCDLAPCFQPYEFMRPAQVDGRGNFNNTVIGPYQRPRVRLPGAAGIPDATNFNRHLHLYVPRHSPQVMVDELDFRSGLGYGGPQSGRWDHSVVEQGPNLILSNLCVFRFEQGRAVLSSLHPGVDLDEVRGQTGFRFDTAPGLSVTEPPSEHELELIREHIDPLGARKLEFLPAAGRKEALNAILAAEAARAPGKTLEP